MNKFNWKLINQPETVVHCETEEQAKELLTEADRMGFTWNNGNLYTTNNYYERYKDDTHYNIYDGSFGVGYCYANYKILTFEESKMKNKLEVTLKIQPDGKTVVAECTSISDELRGKGVLAEKDGYKVESNNYLTVCKKDLCVRGGAII